MKNNNKKVTPAGLGIGDVSKICGVPDYTIRFWEREFKDEFSPSRTPGRQRRYNDNDINKLLQIKKLLWVDKFSIKGAKRIITGNLILSNMMNVKKPSVTDTHDLAMQIAELINHQLTRVESAA